jgi:chromosome partitioning protein
MRTGTHVIVVGNEKGGSGKSTTAVHLAIYLLRQGFRVASIDADSRQQTFTAYIRNRRTWAEAQGLKIPHPTHYLLPLVREDSQQVVQQKEFAIFRGVVLDIEGTADFLVIDTPGFDTHLTRIAHSLADTLVTPLNDSIIDVDVLCHIDPVSGEPREVGTYARLVQRARSERYAIDGRSIDWILVRNRIAMLGSRNTWHVQSALAEIGVRLGARIADGISERVIFRSLFSRGLTVFDDVDPEAIGAPLPQSHISAREEYAALIRALQLPLDDRPAPRKRTRQPAAPSAPADQAAK